MEEKQSLIMNLEAAYIYKDIINNEKTTSKKRDLIKLFSATFPYSLEAIRIDKYYPSSFYCVNHKQYTKKIINVTFDKDYYIWDEENKKRKVIAKRKKIRKYLYNNGFTIDNTHYVFYKRSPAKAKNGYALFIQKSMKKKLLDRSRLGVKFEENELLDLTSLLAYESLISSEIEFTINLDPQKEILLIDDIYGKEFETVASVTREINGELVTKNETINLRNCLTDGQGLLDEVVFQQYNKSDKGFMLLRSDMFKCCAFNTKLQEWFRYKEIETLTDMFGNIYNASDIKLVTTPNSLKFLKFAYKFGDDKKKCYEHWKTKIDDLFGVVKTDKEGNYGNYNRLTYQLINSIPNLNYDDLMELTKEEREYVNLLKNDSAVFKSYLGCDAKSILKLEKMLEDDEDDFNLYENTELMSALLLVNSDVQYTTKFKKMKKDLIASYIGYLKRGKIRIKDAKYTTLFSNPYEMLLGSINKYNNQSIMQGREIYCSYYENSQEFCASRNPHILSGNVMYVKNKYHNEYSWFNLTNNICAINFFDNDAPDRLQGADVDSDTFILIPHYILYQKAKYCEDNFPTPINAVEGKVKPRKYNMNEICKLDIVLSDNYIGKIINLSQIDNSYMNEAIFQGKSFEIIDELYQASSMLSSLSQIEIDKSKKIFDNVKMSKELNKIRHLSSLRFISEKDKYGQQVNKMIVPSFFAMISDFNEYRIFEKFETPLDILQDVLVFNDIRRLKGSKHKNLGELLIKSSGGIYTKNSAKAIYKIIEQCGKRVNGTKIESCILNNKGKITVQIKSKKNAINQLKKLQPSDATILFVLKQCFDPQQEDYFGFRKYSMLTLNLLFMSKRKQVLKCFINKKSNDSLLIKNNKDFNYILFGNKYKKINENLVFGK